MTPSNFGQPLNNQEKFFQMTARTETNSCIKIVLNAKFTLPFLLFFKNYVIRQRGRAEGAMQKVTYMENIRVNKHFFKCSQK